jgi:hypothetical protein
MSTFKDILDGGFEEHARALPAGGGFSGHRSRSVLRSIHRRRRTRAAATVGGSALAVGAVAVGAMALNAPRVARPGLTLPITKGLYPWCDVSTYPVVNPEALGAKIYLGRIYEDLVNRVYVYADPDGTHTALEFDADGVARFTTSNGYERKFWEPDPQAREALIKAGPDGHGVMFFDLGPDGGGGGFDPGGPDGPGLGYEWTTVVPDVVPPGVDVSSLSETLGLSLGFGGSGFAPSWVPQGAIVETVFRWHDGRQLAIRVYKDEPGPEVPDYTDLASVSLRVTNLPDGGVFEITSTYDPSKTWQVACWPYRDGASPIASPNTPPSVGPTPKPSWSDGAGPTPDPGISQGGFDAGPTPSPSYVTPGPTSSAGASLPNLSPAPTP